MAIHTAERSARLRRKAIDVERRRLLISRLQGTQQERDFQEPPICDGYGRIRHFRRDTSAGWPSNPLPIVPAAKALGTPPGDAANALVFQNAACNWRCWYCFVPYQLLSANPRQAEWFTPDQLVGLYLSEPDRPALIDLSGGSPDLVPEWIPWMMDALESAGISEKTYLWSDDNLSTEYVFNQLSDKEINRIGQYPNYGRVGCFKGFDELSFSFNTGAMEGEFERQFEIMRKLINLGLDIYGYVTLTSPTANGIASKVPKFFDRLQAVDANLPLRVVPLEIRMYSPVESRLNQSRRDALRHQWCAIDVWNREIERRFSSELREREISDVPLGVTKPG